MMRLWHYRLPQPVLKTEQSTLIEEITVPLYVLQFTDKLLKPLETNKFFLYLKLFGLTFCGVLP